MGLQVERPSYILRSQIVYVWIPIHRQLVSIIPNSSSQADSELNPRRELPPADKVRNQHAALPSQRTLALILSMQTLLAPLIQVQKRRLGSLTSCLSSCVRADKELLSPSFPLLLLNSPLRLATRPPKLSDCTTKPFPTNCSLQERPLKTI